MLGIGFPGSWFSLCLQMQAALMIGGTEMANSKDMGGRKDQKSPQMDAGKGDKSGKQQDQAAPGKASPGTKQQGSDQRRDQHR